MRLRSPSCIEKEQVSSRKRTSLPRCLYCRKASLHRFECVPPLGGARGTTAQTEMKRSGGLESGDNFGACDGVEARIGKRDCAFSLSSAGVNARTPSHKSSVRPMMPFKRSGKFVRQLRRHQRAKLGQHLVSHSPTDGGAIEPRLNATQ